MSMDQNRYIIVHNIQRRDPYKVDEASVDTTMWNHPTDEFEH